jgi:hypothetical protein
MPDPRGGYVPPWWYEPLNGLLAVLSAMQTQAAEGFGHPLHRGVLKLMAKGAPVALRLLGGGKGAGGGGEGERREYGGALPVMDTNRRAVLVRGVRATWAVTEEVSGVGALQ